MTTQPRQSPEVNHDNHGRHGWMMIACCIPMLVIAVALVATGTASPGFLVFALLCTAMMALMMKGMNHGTNSDSNYDKSSRKTERDHHR
ncbi:MAG: hypothetical protein WC864_01175 [Ilumatobacteraceae bacterium]